MDQMPPTREQLERMPLPELLRTAQSLGADLAYVHDRRDVVDALAAQRQQLLSRYADELMKFKIRLEGHGQELSLSAQEYQATYDRVEQAVTDRFAALHDQLLRKEVEVRGQLAILKNNGDDVLQDCRAAMDRELANLQDVLAKCQSRDIDVLDITPATSPVTVAVPHLTGRCFVFSDCGALELASLRVALDLQATSRAVQMTPPSLPPLNPNGAPQPGSGAPLPITAGPGASRQYPGAAPSPARHHSVPGSGRGWHPAAEYGAQPTPLGDAPAYGAARPAGEPAYGPGYGGARPGYGGAPPAYTPTARLTFPADSEIESREDPHTGGQVLRMIPEAGSEVVGARALETFTEGLHVWKVRLDRFDESLLGVVDCRDTTSHLAAGDGFFWSPVRGDVHGQRGRPTAALKRHPPAHPSDVLALTFDADAGTLQVTHNGADRGVVCTDLRGVMSPCFIFSRGEQITLLH